MVRGSPASGRPTGQAGRYSDCLIIATGYGEQNVAGVGASAKTEPRCHLGMDLGRQRTAGIAWARNRDIAMQADDFGIAGLHRACQTGKGKSEATYLGGDSVPISCDGSVAVSAK